MIGFEPLKIELEILFPIVQGGGYPIHLDSLLYWALIGMGSSHIDALDHLDLALSKSSGVYHASQALYIKGLNSSVVATAITRLTKFEWSEYAGNFSKNKKSIKENEGQFRKLFTTKLATKANKVVFFAHGHKDRILFLLNSLMGIGRNSQAGFGEIAKIEIVNVVDDYSWFYNDKLNRILPTNIFSIERNEPVRCCRYTPDYSRGEAIDCYVPVMNTIPLSN